MSRWVSDCCLTQTQQSSWREQVNFQWNNDQVHFVQDQHDFYSASLLKQHSADRHVTPLGHIILIPSQPVFALSSECCMLTREETNTNFIVFGLTQSGLEPTIYRTRFEHANHYTTDAVNYCMQIGRVDCSNSFITLLTKRYNIPSLRHKWAHKWWT